MSDLKSIVQLILDCRREQEEAKSAAQILSEAREISEFTGWSEDEILRMPTERVETYYRVMREIPENIKRVTLKAKKGEKLEGDEAALFERMEASRKALLKRIDTDR